MKLHQQELLLIALFGVISACSAASRRTNLFSTTGNSIVNEEYDSILRFTDGENPEYGPRINRWYLEKLFRISDIKKTYVYTEDIERRRNKRRTYLTLCHFKICNMGRKRTTTTARNFLDNMNPPPAPPAANNLIYSNLF